MSSLDENLSKTPAENLSAKYLHAEDLVSRTGRITQVLDGMLASTVLSCASMLPGPAGISAAMATVTFDVTHRYWVGALLSGLSLIPLAGYLPGAMKIAWNVSLLSRKLDEIEILLPEIEQRPELLTKVQEVVGKYSGKLQKVRVAGKLSAI